MRLQTFAKTIQYAVSIAEIELNISKPTKDHSFKV